MGNTESAGKFKTVCAFLKNGTCSRTLMTVLDGEHSEELRPEELATDPLAGGLMHGYQCGMLWGSTLAAGAQAHRIYGAGPRAEAAAMHAAKGLVASFQDRFGSTDCGDITETNPQNGWEVFVYHFLKGGVVRCAGRMASFAQDARQEIDAALVDTDARTSCNAASCAATLARKMGASEQHATMAAGLAGGIGMSGGACGALGAAIWLIGLRGQEQGLSNKEITAQISTLMEQFLQLSGHAYECSEIVERQFQGVEDHAAHLQRGGCEQLLDELAAAAGMAQEMPQAPELAA